MVESKIMNIFNYFRYLLLVVQQPGSVEANCFRGNRTNRSCISPCPIFQLSIKREKDTLEKEYSMLGDVDQFMAHAIILSEAGENQTWVNTASLNHDPKDRLYLQQLKSRQKEQVGHEQPLMKAERLLCGKIVSSCYVLNDTLGDTGAYFIFEDLSLNMEGKYKLRIIVSDLSAYFDIKANRCSCKEDRVSSPICSIETDVFECFSPGYYAAGSGKFEFLSIIRINRNQQAFC